LINHVPADSSFFFFSCRRSNLIFDMEVPNFYCWVVVVKDVLVGGSNILSFKIPAIVELVSHHVESRCDFGFWYQSGLMMTVRSASFFLRSNDLGPFGTPRPMCIGLLLCNLYAFLGPPSEPWSLLRASSSHWSESFSGSPCL
jgi:hypothetical protein